MGKGHIVFLVSSFWVCMFCKMLVCIVHFSYYAIPVSIQFHYLIVYNDYFSVVALISSGFFFSLQCRPFSTDRHHIHIFQFLNLGFISWEDLFCSYVNSFIHVCCVRCTNESFLVTKHRW